MSEAYRTTDLVARIREHEGAYLFPKTADALLKEAADEIERLNEQLMKAFGIWPSGSTVHGGTCGHEPKEGNEHGSSY